jgi:hypothetical protein
MKILNTLAMLILLVPLSLGCDEEPKEVYTVTVATTLNCRECDRDKPLVARLKQVHPEIMFEDLCYCDPDQHDSLRAQGITSYPTYVVYRQRGQSLSEIYRTHEATKLLEGFGVK